MAGRAVLRELTPNVYQLVLEAVTRGQGGEAEPAQASGKAAGKGARAGRLNSALVFAIETFEGLLIQLDKSGARRAPVHRAPPYPRQAIR